MEKYFKVIFIMIEYKDMENSLFQMEHSQKVYGETLNLLKLLVLEFIINNNVKMVNNFVIIFFYH